MTTKKLIKLLALYLPYILLGLVATNFGEAWRLAEGKELGDKIMSMMGTIPVAFANPLPSLHPLDLLVGLCCGAGLRLAVYLRGKNAKKYRHGMEYGSARWGTPKDIEPFMAPKFADNIILTKTERLMMSNRPPDPKNARNKNVLVVGGSGSGKTRFWLKPNLLQCHSSYVVTDPKGSIVVECGNALLKKGYKLKILNTINFSKSMHYNTVQETQVAQQSADISKKRRHLATAQKRAGELEKLICKIYEDNALGKLPDTRYKALDAQYAKEQDALEIEIAELEKAVTGYEQSQKSAEKFIALIDKYENFDTLTNTMLNEFVEKILVHERSRKGSQDTTQEIEIYFNFLGRYIPPSLQPVPLTPEEQEELRKREERKDRLHQNYLKRKASGAQKRYEDKIKAKKKAEMDAKKALIRAEDMKKGVFSTIGQLPKEEPRKGSIAASAAV